MLNLENFENNFIDNTVNEMIKQQVKDMDNVIFDFLKANGFRPKRTERYAIYLRKKLEKQGFKIVVDKINEQIDFDGTTYSHKYYLVPRFEKISKCDNCPAKGNFNGCPCYFGNEEEDCKLTKKQIIKMIYEYEEENEAFYRSYGC